MPHEWISGSFPGDEGGRKRWRWKCTRCGCTKARAKNEPTPSPNVELQRNGQIVRSCDDMILFLVMES